MISPLALKGGAVLLALLGAYGAGRFHQHEADARRIQAQRLAAVEAARAREQQWQIDAAAAEETHDDEIRRIAADHAADLERMRQRAGRMPAASAASCAGASGAELSGPDAGFLVGLAAEADRTRADLERCRAWVEAVTRPL